MGCLILLMGNLVSAAVLENEVGDVEMNYDLVTLADFLNDVNFLTEDEINDYVEQELNSLECNQWTNHEDAGYLTSESDDIFLASPAADISEQDKLDYLEKTIDTNETLRVTNLELQLDSLNLNDGNWDSAFAWGDHALAGYVVESDLDRANWDSAFAWGDHEGLYAPDTLEDVVDNMLDSIDAMVELDTNLTESDVDAMVSNNGYVEQINLDYSSGRKSYEGIKIYLTKGWNEFRLPSHVLKGINNVPGLDLIDYDVETVLNSISGDYSIVTYYDGSWKIFDVGASINTFESFPVGALTPHYTFSIMMTNDAELIIPLKNE